MKSRLFIQRTREIARTGYYKSFEVVTTTDLHDSMDYKSVGDIHLDRLRLNLEYARMVRLREER